MNDRFLFKAKRIDNGEWVIGNLVFSVYHKGDDCVGQMKFNLNIEERRKNDNIKVEEAY